MNIFDSKNNLGWSDYLNILKRRKWYFILPFLLILPFGALKIRSTRPIYAAFCTIKIQPSSLRLLPSSIRKALPHVQSPETVYSVRKQILSSEYLLEVIERLDLKKNETYRAEVRATQGSFLDKDLDEIIELALLKMLKKTITVEKYSPDIIVLRARARTADLAFSLVQTLSEIYIDDSHRRAESSIQGALSFNYEQLSIFKERLLQAERKLEAFRRKLITGNIGNQDLARESLVRINRALLAIDITIREKRDYLESVQSQLKGKEVTDEYPINAIIQKYSERIDAKNAEMAFLMQNFSWQSPEVNSANRKINDLRQNILNEIESMVKERYPGMGTAILNVTLEEAITVVDLEILNRKTEVLSKTIASFADIESQKPSQDMTLTKLQGDVAVNRRIYNTFLRQNQGVEIEEMLTRQDASNRFHILDPPRKPLEPMNAGARMIMFGTLAAALFCGGAAVQLREFMDKSIRSMAEATEYLGLPVIGVIPYLGIEAVNSPRNRLFILIAAGTLILFAALALLYLKFGPIR